MKSSLTPAFAVAMVLSLGAGLVQGQEGHMMNGGGWMGGYGGVWIPILLVVVVAWIVMQRRK